MQWIAPSEKDSATNALEKRLWEAADQLRANSGLTAAQYSNPVLGLIFLRFAEARFAKRRAELETPSSAKAGESRGEGRSRRGSSRIDGPGAYHAEGVVYLTPNARYDRLLNLPEGGNVGKEINDAITDIEKHNPHLAGVLPHTYQIFNSTLLKQLLKKVSEIPDTLEYDAFGRIYEYAGSRNIEEIFRELLDLSSILTQEQTRHVRENLSEEELTIFDILTRPGPDLTTQERDEVKKVAHQLLDRLRELLVIGWRQRVGSRARVRLAIEDALDDGLPRAYSKDLFQTKCSAVFEHVYESYQGEGKSVYSERA